VTKIEPVDVFNIISFIVLVVGLAAAIMAFYKTNLGNTIIDHQSTLIATLNDKVELLTQEQANYKSQVDAYKSQVEELKHKNSYLEGIVTGKNELNSILQEVQGIRRDISTLENLFIASSSSGGSSA
jgi:peptidoglycan hydrolase CwlO-like protein